MMAGLARAVLTHRKLIFSLWIALTLLGAFAANRVSKRWLEQFSIPGYSAYETNQRTLKIFGSGEQPPHIALLSVKKGDVTKTPGVEASVRHRGGEVP
jgi:predicted RND superfamily exporter protein